MILDEPSDGLDPEGIHDMRQMILRLHQELKLTILLSSHFLSEVEHLCTSIAVLNQGRKVFEGPIAATRGGKEWVRLVVGDFAAATTELKRLSLISGSDQGRFITLASGVTTDQIVRKLVEIGMPVYEIAREETTLEQFYLDLMNREQPPVSRS
jgi:ABC-2 type transport system ATP-binding protein